jgi:hypothetical protein
LLTKLSADHIERQIHLGRSVDPIEALYVVPWVRAERVTAEWIDTTAPAEIDSPEVLIHLGTADGVFVLYDVCGDRTLRLSTERVALASVPSVDDDADPCGND